MSQGDLMQLLLAVCVAPTALVVGLIVTYFVANVEQIKYKVKNRKECRKWRSL